MKVNNKGMRNCRRHHPCASLKWVLWWSSMILLGYGVLYLWLNYRLDVRWMPPEWERERLASSLAKRRGNATTRKPSRVNPDGPLLFRDDWVEDVESAYRKGAPAWDGRVKEVDWSLVIEKGKKEIKLTRKFLQKFSAKAKSVHQLANKKLKKLVGEKRADGLPPLAIPLVFTLVNSAYLRLTLNWLCNTHAISSATPKSTKAANSANATIRGSVHVHEATLLVTPFQPTCSLIKRDWPKVECISVSSGAKKEKKKDHEDQEDGGIYDFDSELPPGGPRQREFLATRANLIAALAEAKLPTLVFEVDSVWFHNPLTVVESGRGNGSVVGLPILVESDKKADLLLLQNSHFRRRGSSVGQKQKQHLPYGASPMLLRPTAATRRTMQEWRRIVNRPTAVAATATNTPSNRQQLSVDPLGVLNHLCAMRYAGVKCGAFSRDEVRDGLWFKSTEKERRVGASSRGSKNKWIAMGHYAPAIVENNAYSSAHNKEARQLVNSLWFLSKGSGRKCIGVKEVNKLLAKYDSPL